MNIDELKNSRFQKKEDCDPPITVTIDHVDKRNVAELGEKPEFKWCLFFRDGIKPMVLNSTNAQLIARLLGSKNSDDWIGKEIELYHDPNVTYAGELVGGIRVRRAPQKMAAAPPERENGEIGTEKPDGRHVEIAN